MYTYPSNPSVAIVTVYHNRAPFVEKSIQSLLNQTYENLQIIVVDDGSTDSTLDELNKFKHPMLRIVDKFNTGFTNSLQKIISEIDADFIAIHGSGDISHPNRIKTQLDCFLNNPDVVLCGTRNRNIDPKTNLELDCSPYIQGNFLFEPDFIHAPPFTHGAAMFARRAYLQAGGYDNRFDFCQDWDLWFRLLRIGRAYCTNEILYDRIAQVDGASINPSKAIRQLIFKQLVMATKDLDLDTRNGFIERYLLNPKSLPNYDHIFADLSRRRVKLRLMNLKSSAVLIDDHIKTQSTDRYLLDLLACKILDFLGAIGINPSSCSHIGRNALEFARKCKVIA